MNIRPTAGVPSSQGNIFQNTIPTKAVTPTGAISNAVRAIQERGSGSKVNACHQAIRTNTPKNEGITQRVMILGSVMEKGFEFIFPRYHTVRNFGGGRILTRTNLSFQTGQKGPNDFFGRCGPFFPVVIDHLVLIIVR